MNWVMKTLQSFLLSLYYLWESFSFFEGVFCESSRWGNGKNGVRPWVALLCHSEVYSVFCFLFFSVLPFLLLSAWFSWMTRRLWATSWKSWWRKITFSWPTRFALISMKVLASSSCLPWSRISARLALPLPPCLDPPTLALSLDQRKTGEEIGLRKRRIRLVTVLLWCSLLFCVWLLIASSWATPLHWSQGNRQDMLFAQGQNCPLVESSVVWKNAFSLAVEVSMMQLLWLS